MKATILNPNYQLPELTSKEAVLRAIREIAQGVLTGAVEPKRASSVLYALQVAMQVHNSSMEKH